MKKIIIVINIIFLNCILCTAQEIAPAPADKAVVYFLKGCDGTYFDSTKLIGIFRGSQYFRYECEPGSHLFWAQLPQIFLEHPPRDFIEANIEAGKIYFIEADSHWKVSTIGIELNPLDPKDEKNKNRIFKLLTKKQAEALTKEKMENFSERLQGSIKKGIAEYKDKKQAGKIFKRLEKTMYYE